MTCDVSGMGVFPYNMMKEVSAEVWKHDLFSFSLAPCADFHCEPVTEGPCYQAQCWWFGPLLRYPDRGKSYSRLKEKASWSAWDIFWEGEVLVGCLWLGGKPSCLVCTAKEGGISRPPCREESREERSQVSLGLYPGSCMLRGVRFKIKTLNCVFLYSKWLSKSADTYSVQSTEPRNSAGHTDGVYWDVLIWLQYNSLYHNTTKGCENGVLIWCA